jgi:anti-anti-sigma factor
MKIDKSLHDDYATLTLKGDFDTFYCPALMQEVDALIDRGVSMLILDMHVVKFINSTALGAVIKAHKRCRAEGGDLVVAQPSAFVKNVMKTLAEATKAIVKQLNQRELAGTGTADHEKVLITFPDEVRNRMIPRQQLVHTGTKSLVGQMANVDGDRVQFTWSFEKASMSAEQGKELFFSGSDAHLKFQVKLIKKSYFEVDAVIANAEATADGMRVTAHFKKIADGDRDALAQFAADMAFLKRQLPGK